MLEFITEMMDYVIMIHAMSKGLRIARHYPLVILIGLAGVLGGALSLAAHPSAARWAVSVVCLALAARLTVTMVRELRRGVHGVDLLAIVAIVSTVLVGQHWAALVICLMLTGGEALEDYARGRAGRSLSALLDNAPQEVGRISPDGEVDRIPVDRVAIGDRIQVRPGEMVGVDGLLEVGNATLDESSLTGEAMPVRRRPGEPAAHARRSGSVPFRIERASISSRATPSAPRRRPTRRSRRAR